MATLALFLVFTAKYPPCSLPKRIFLLTQKRQIDAHRPLHVAQAHSLHWRVEGGGGGFYFNL